MIQTVVLDSKLRVKDAKDILVPPVIIRVGYIDEEMLPGFKEAVNRTHDCGQPFVVLEIDSHGGDVYSLLAIVDILESSKLPIATIVTGKAMSCGAVLFCCGSQGYRFIGPRATLMIHDVTTEELGGKPDEMKVDTEETDRLNRLLYSLMERKIGKRNGYLWRLMQKRGRTDYYLSAEDARRAGIANHIAVPKLITKVTVDISLDW